MFEFNIILSLKETSALSFKTGKLAFHNLFNLFHE